MTFHLSEENTADLVSNNLKSIRPQLLQYVAYLFTTLCIQNGNIKYEKHPHKKAESTLKSVHISSWEERQRAEMIFGIATMFSRYEIKSLVSPGVTHAALTTKKIPISHTTFQVLE